MKEDTLLAIVFGILLLFGAYTHVSGIIECSIGNDKKAYCGRDADFR